MSSFNLELFERAGHWNNRVAVMDATGTFTYRDLLDRAAAIGDALGALTQRRPTVSGDDETSIPRVAYLVAPGFRHVATQWSIWHAGATGVPLSAAQAPAEWAYVIDDANAAVVVCDEDHVSPMQQALAGRATTVVPTARLDVTRSVSQPSALQPRHDAGALILYTSGTTGKPKGVVLTHANLEAQVRCLTAAWEWRQDDRILHVLPLHHVHGIVNVLMCALWAGAACEMLAGFDAEAVWDVTTAGRLTLFMAVPTIYSKLIAAWERATPERRRAMSDGCRAMRLMVSGSAALPVRVLDRWREISGHVLLERYGMTEIGMALSNPLHGERRPGAVGTPLPGVRVRIVDEHGAEVAPGVAGELEVAGAGVFREYWRRPEATAAAFHDGWFRTGNVAVLEDGMYRLLGRQSVDIIKSGGYKISALEIEEVLREHEDIAECAVVGIEDPEWGEIIAVAAVPQGAAVIDLDRLRDWSRSRLARYKLPARLLCVPDLPRNAMGKVSKPAVRKLFMPT